jgi:hypothetical protein
MSNFEKVVARLASVLHDGLIDGGDGPTRNGRADMSKAIRLGDTVAGNYFNASRQFEGVVTMADSNIYIRLTTPCHHYQIGELIAIDRRDMTRCDIKTIKRPSAIDVDYDAAAGVRYVA